MIRNDVDGLLLCDIIQTIEEFEIKNGFENVSNIPFEIGHYQTETILHLNDKIDHWRGVQLTRLKGKTMDNFKSYFVIGVCQIYCLYCVY